MHDGSVNKRFTDVEKSVRRIEGKINRLEIDIESQRETTKAGVSPQNTASEEHDSAQGRTTPAPQSPPSPTDSNQSKKPWYKTLQGWKTLFEMIAIPFAIVYAVVTCFQWRDLRHNFQTDERSWIRIGYNWPSAPADQPFQMVSVLSNVGKSGITHLYAHGTLEVVDAKSEPSFNIENYHSFDFVAPIFPTDTTNFWISPYNQKTLATRGFTSQELVDLRSGAKYLAVFGIVIYSDQFGVHWYRFCNWHSYGPLGSQANASDCSIWNRTGDGLKGMPYPNTAAFEKANEDKLSK